MTRRLSTSLPASVFVTIATAGLMAAQGHQTHHDAVKARGASVMGFDQNKTTHHFYLYDDGGAIDISANDPKDELSIHAIRIHLQKAALEHGRGDYAMPHEIHTRPMGGHDHAHSIFVPGVAVLSRLKSEVRYRYSPTPVGGRVDIQTANSDALKALHDFLRYQIADHRTGDPTTISKR